MADHGLVDHIDIGIVFKEFVMLAQLSEKNIRAAFGRWEEDRNCTFGLGGNRKVGDDLHIFKILQLLEVLITDHQAGDVHSLAIAIIAMMHFAHRVIIARRSKNDAFGSIGLSN